MNFSSMDYFIAVARERSFTKAAEQLHITQQSLSAHIAALEQELGCKLLVRHVPLELTYGGEVFLRYAAGFQQDMNAMRQEFCDITENQKGVLRVGVAFTRGHVIMPDLITEFQKKYPNISVELAEASNEGLHRNLLNGEIDVAIANFPESLQGVEQQDFYREEVVLFIACSLLKELYGEGADAAVERIAAGEMNLLKNCPFVLNDSADIAGKIGRFAVEQANLQPVIKAKAANIETLLSLCVRGSGACFCPENLARATLSKAELAALYRIRLGGYAEYPIRFGYLKQSYQWSIIEEFMKTARMFYAERREG